MDEAVVAGRLLEMMESEPILADYFQTNIRWLQDRLELWRKHYIRIGLVGVTSSGKSTLINALLGEELLPAAVRPSSGTLITCAYGKQLQATLYFSDGHPPQVLTGPDLRQQIAEYADERSNPANCKRVKYIALESPGYMLDPSLQIVDSPGLDADGHDHHEALTMEELLPTVDMCLYVVTLKANSDHTTHRIIESIYYHKKPLIIVQNMLDSVEKKTGRNGIVLRTKDEVAEDHKKRVERIVGSIDPLLQQMVSIVQVSSKHALVGRISRSQELWNCSRFNDLRRTVTENLNRMLPEIRQQRLFQIHWHLCELLATEEQEAGMSDETNASAVPASLVPYLEKENEIQARFQLTQHKVNNITEQIGSEFQHAMRELRELSQKQLYQASAQMDELKGKVRGLEDSLIHDLRSFSNDLSALLKMLNLNAHDYLGSGLPNKGGSENAFRVKKLIIKETRRVEKSSTFSKVSRFFGKYVGADWGYEEVEKDVEVFDRPAMEQSLQLYYQNTLAQMNSFFEQWTERMTDLQDVVNTEVRRRKLELESKRKAFLAKEKVSSLLATFAELEGALRQQLGMVSEEAAPASEHASVPETAPIPVRTQTVQPVREQMKVSKAVLALHQLGQNLIGLHFRAAWTFCQKLNNKRQAEAFKTTVIWGWDEFSILQFCYRFLNLDVDADALSENGYLVFQEESHRYLIVNEISLSSESMATLYLLLERELYNAYVLVNAIQEGATKKQIRKGPLLQMPSPETRVINWVGQSLEEFKVGSNVDEGLFSLMGIQAEFDPSKRGSLLLNDSNPIYSLLLCEMSQHPILTLNEERQIVQRLIRSFSYLVRTSELEYCTQLIKSYAATLKKESM